MIGAAYNDIIVYSYQVIVNRSHKAGATTTDRNNADRNKNGLHARNQNRTGANRSTDSGKAATRTVQTNAGRAGYDTL